MSEVAIRVSHLSKLYRIGEAEQRHETLLGAALSFLKSPISNYRSLRRLSKFDDVLADDTNQRSEVRNQKSALSLQLPPPLSFQLSTFSFRLPALSLPMSSTPSAMSPSRSSAAR